MFAWYVERIFDKAAENLSTNSKNNSLIIQKYFSKHLFFKNQMLYKKFLWTCRLRLPQRCQKFFVENHNFSSRIAESLDEITVFSEKLSK